MASVGAGSAYAVSIHGQSYFAYETWLYEYQTDIVAVQRVYYNQIYNFSCACVPSNSCTFSLMLRNLDQWMVVMSTQLIGFSIGGIARRFLVLPPSMIWPTNLVTCALFNTLHSQQYSGVGNRGGVSRERFFSYMFLIAFVWCKFNKTRRKVEARLTTLSRLLPWIHLSV